MILHHSIDNIYFRMEVYAIYDGSVFTNQMKSHLYTSCYYIQIVSRLYFTTKLVIHKCRLLYTLSSDVFKVMVKKLGQIQPQRVF